MFNPKVQSTQKPQVSKQPEPPKAEPFTTEPAHPFSEDQIRIRAFEIYESGNRNSNRPEADWSQAETELMELVHAK